jgi:hypothetical protein
MNFSGYPDQPSSSFSGDVSSRCVSSIRLRSALISRDCPSGSHRVASHRAMPALAILETPSGPPRGDLAGPPVRHANCSYYVESESESEGEREMSAFEMDVFEIWSEGFGAIVCRAPLPFVEAIGLPKFFRIEAESGSPGSGSLERIVRQPTRRDSTCVPQ